MDAFAALGMIRDECGWHIAPVLDTTHRLDSDGSRLVVLPTLRLVGVSSVTVDGQPVTDYEWSENGMLRLASVPPRKFGAVEVTMSHGYDDMPAIVTAITAALETSEAGPRREQVGSVSAEWSEAGAVGVLDEYQLRALDRYRLGPRP